MTTRADMLALIRTELNDSGGTALWASALLNGYIVEAIREYARELPKEATTTLTTVVGTETVALPSDFVRMVRVEEPTGVLRWPLTTQRTYEATVGSLSELVDFESRVGESGKPGYRIWAGNLVLDPAPSTTSCPIEYLASYATPTADASVLTTPAYDDDVIMHLACAKALDWITTDESKRQRYERSRGVSAYDVARQYRGIVEAELARRRSFVRSTTLELSE